MSWSVTLNDVQGTTGFNIELELKFASMHPSYPRDMAKALELAKSVGLRSATLTGIRTPNPYGGDEVVDISVRGFPQSGDFFGEMREIITSGPGTDTAVARHYVALARLRARPCPHVWKGGESGPEPRGSGTSSCIVCGVVYEGGMLRYDEEPGRPD